MRRKNKAQFAIEFVILISFMFVIFLGFTAVITSKILEAKENERQKIADDIGILIKNEIELATTLSDGYKRTFEIPLQINGNDYEVTVVDNRELVVTYLDKEYVVFLPDNYIGDIGVGLNEITKENGIVYTGNIQQAFECSDLIDNDLDGLIDLNDAGCSGQFDDDETNCGDNVCEGLESCLICSSDCGNCFGLLILLIKGTANVIAFDDSGNAILKGTLQKNTQPSQTTDDEFVYRDSSGTNVALVNLVTGNMVIKGDLFENQATLTPSGDSDDFIVRDSNSNAVSYIDDSGNFYLKGTLTQNGNP